MPDRIVVYYPTQVSMTDCVYKNLRDSVKPSAHWKQLAMEQEIHKSFKDRLVNEVFVLKMLCAYLSCFFFFLDMIYFVMFQWGTQVRNGKVLKGFIIFPLHSTADAVLQETVLPTDLCRARGFDVSQPG